MFVKLSFRELCDSKLPGLQAFDNMVIIHKFKVVKNQQKIVNHNFPYDQQNCIEIFEWALNITEWAYTRWNYGINKYTVSPINTYEAKDQRPSKNLQPCWTSSKMWRNQILWQTTTFWI